MPASQAKNRIAVTDMMMRSANDCLTRTANCIRSRRSSGSTTASHHPTAMPLTPNTARNSHAFGHHHVPAGTISKAPRKARKTTVRAII